MAFGGLLNSFLDGNDLADARSSKPKMLFGAQMRRKNGVSAFGGMSDFSQHKHSYAYGSHSSHQLAPRVNGHQHLSSHQKLSCQSCQDPISGSTHKRSWTGQPAPPSIPDQCAAPAGAPVDSCGAPDGAPVAMWGGQKEKQGGSSDVLMGPFGIHHHHPHHHRNHQLYRGMHEFDPHMGGHHERSPLGMGQRPTVLWKGDTARKKRFEAFCSPAAPHVPIRQRLARRGTSGEAVDVGEEPMSSYCSVYNGGQRRRRMSLLQSLRQQNRHLADSGLDIRRRTDSEATRDTCSPPLQSPPASPKKSFSAFKAKLFGRKESKHPRVDGHESVDCSQSCDGMNGGRSRKSPSTTNDSGRGSQGHLEERLEPPLMEYRPRKRIARTSSCPDIAALSISGRRSMDSESDEDERAQCSSPITAADCLLERRLARKAVEMEARRSLHHHHPHHPRPVRPLAILESDSSPEPAASQSAASNASEGRGSSIRSTPGARSDSPSSTPVIETPVQNASSSVRSLTAEVVIERSASVASSTSPSLCATEDLSFYDDDSVSGVLLDRYMRTSTSRLDFCEKSADESLSHLLQTENLEKWDALESRLSHRTDREASILDEDSQAESTATQDSLLTVDSRDTVGVQTECGEACCHSGSCCLAPFLQALAKEGGEEGMNFIAKHFFEYQSFVNLPHKAIQMHKTPASQAGTDPSMGWAPKNMNKCGKNQPAPAARANKQHRDPRPNGTKYGRAGKHEHREWGDRHGELRDEKVAGHKDAWTKFLSNEDPGQRTMFECDFEDRVLMVDDETMHERVHRVEHNELDFQMAYNANKSSGEGCELLTILTYAPTVQFVTATVKKAKQLPYNNAPFARIMLFEGRRLVEQKQTTVTPMPEKPESSSSSSSSVTPGDAAFSESFLFHIAPSKLERTHIVIEMFDRLPSNEPVSVGHCVIGKLGDGTGRAHWVQMLRKHGLPVCMWHRIGP